MTKERKNELILLFNQGFTYERIAERFGTTRAYIENQFREIRKLENTYNLEHIEDKYRTNKLFKNSALGLTNTRHRHSSAATLCSSHIRFMTVRQAYRTSKSVPS